MIEFDDEKDGSVSIDLCAGEGKMLAISIEPNGEICWALYWDGHRDHGKHQLPKREWVGLNWDDLPEIYVGDKAFLHGAKWAEAMLRSKNT